jgi:predicted transcriptional regulator
MQNENRWASFRPDEKDTNILKELDAGGSKPRELAAATGIKEDTVRYHLMTMELAGLVKSEKRRHNVVYFKAKGKD